MDKFPVRMTLASAFVVLAIAGCSSGSGEQTGRISIGVSDGPMHDAAKVCIAFTEIELKPKNGPPILVKPTDVDSTMDDGISNIDLLEHQGNNAAPLLIDYEVPADEYLWLRLGVNAALGGTGGLDDMNMPDMVAMGPCVGDESYLMMKGQDETTAGEIYNLYIPSGDDSGLKLHGSIIVPHGGAADFTAEIDLRKSVAYPDGLFPDAIFRPTIRLVNNIDVGALTGTVDSGLLASCAEPSVFVFVADGVEDAALDASNYLTSVMVDAEGHYTVGFLLAGDYELALSCGEGTELQPIGGESVTVGEVKTVP